jgi:hypothetical protein
MPEHCPGCRGYTGDFAAECPGITPSGTALTVTRGVLDVTQQYVPRLTWRARLDVLLGRPVLVATHAVSYGGGGGGGTGHTG